MIDENGYRANVGIILSNERGAACSGPDGIGQNAWQFPQGGIDRGRIPRAGDVSASSGRRRGSEPEHVEVLGCTRSWLQATGCRKRYVRRNQSPLCIGQKQKWYMLRMLGERVVA